jgi:alpha-ribazole phosphatase/probable phosphoglycerate mutase
MHRRIILVRHGHSDGNNAGLDAPLSGWHDTPLNDRGWRETDELADRLRGEVQGSAVICSSPLQRCLRLAEAIGAAVGGTIEREPDLREIFCGELEGRPIGEAQRRYPELWAANLRQDSDEFRWPGGESYAEFRQRCLSCLDRIRRSHPTALLILVSHAGVISQFIGALRGTPSGHWAEHRPGNASITELADDGATLTLVRFDDQQHLKAA